MSNSDGMAPLPFAAGRALGSRPSDNTARLQNLRNLIHSERHASADRRRISMEILDREMLEMAGEPISARLNRRARGLETQSNEHDAAATPRTPPTGSPMAFQRRRRIVRPSERLARIRRAADPADSIADAMEETSTALSRPPPPIEPSDIAIQEYVGEAQFHRETRWRAKRRKLDDGTYEDEEKTFSYGHNGQVVAGPLKLEIVSCDGGAYSEPHIGSSWPQNVLADDASVYCTKSNRCNMMLKHVGGMPFSLTKLVVKAPRDGYDAPIEEGMIFVSMDKDKLLERTAPYEIRYSPKKPRELWRRERNHIRLGPSREYMNSVRSPLRSSYLRDPYPARDMQDSQSDLVEMDLVPEFDVSTTYDVHSDNEGSLQRSPRARRLGASYYTDHYAPSAGVSDYYRPTYHDTDNEDDSQDSTSSVVDNEADNARDPSGRTYLDDRNPYSTRHRRIMRSRQVEQVYDAHAAVSTRDIHDDFTRAYRQLEAGQPEYSSRRLRTRPSRIEVRPDSRRQDTPDVRVPPEDVDEGQSPVASEPLDACNQAVDTKANAEMLDVIKPHARFFIRRDKSSVSISFEPPVAGRYILIKLWAPCPNANIDIQSIVAHGYGGPRFFPAYEPH